MLRLILGLNLTSDVVGLLKTLPVVIGKVFFGLYGWILSMIDGGQWELEAG